MAKVHIGSPAVPGSALADMASISEGRQRRDRGISS